MPLVEVNGPKMASIEKKRELVEKLTKVVSEVYGTPDEGTIVIIRENAHENVGRGGKLLADLHRK